MRTIKILLLLTLLASLTATAFAGTNDDPENSRSYIEKKFVGVLIGQIGGDPDKLSGDTKLREDLGADDLDLVELLMALEEYFDIVVTDAQWQGVTTIKSAVDLIYDIKNSRGW
jgi:acyl carrier protein